jgi:hypothetical protein
MDISHLAILALALLLGACSASSDPSMPRVGAATIPDVTVFLAQVRCADGNLEVAEPGCAGAAPQKASDAMLVRRFDWAPAGITPGYQASDSYAADRGNYYVATWSYPPFGPLVAANGDGGEIYVTDGTTVRIAATEDGGKIGVLQGFYGASCGGTGWIAFRNDAPTGRWATLVAQLNIRPVPSACPGKLNAAFTRYRLERVAFPFIIGGNRTTITLSTIIGEHYNAASIAQASAMERTFWTQGAGRTLWESWTTGTPAGADLATHCPGTTWSVAPAPGWALSDCRNSTNIVATDGSLTGDSYGYPPAGLALP